MKIRMLTSIAGNADERYGLEAFAFAPGEVVDVHKDLAAAWIKCGHAEKAKPAPVQPAAEETKPAADDAQPQQEGA